MKLLCSDYDGTLAFRTEESISYVYPRDIKSVNDFILEGNHFVVATGRSYKAGKIPLDEAGVNYNYLIADSGASIIDREGNVIFRKKINYDDITRVISIIKKHEPTSYEISNGNISSLTQIGEMDDDMKFKKQSRFFSGNEEEIIRNDSAIQIGVKFIDSKQIPLFINELNDSGCKVIAHINNLNVDITNADCSKEEAINILREINNYSEVYAIGNDYNDIGMIKDNCGFAIRGSEKEVIDSAKYIVDNISECIEMIRGNNL